MACAIWTRLPSMIRRGPDVRKRACVTVSEDTARGRRTQFLHGMAAWGVVARYGALAGRGGFGAGLCRLPRRVGAERRIPARARCVTPPARGVGRRSACSKIASLGHRVVPGGDLGTRSAPGRWASTRVVRGGGPTQSHVPVHEGVLKAVEPVPKPKPAHVRPKPPAVPTIAWHHATSVGLPYGGSLVHGTQIPRCAGRTG